MSVEMTTAELHTMMTCPRRCTLMREYGLPTKTYPVDDVLRAAVIAALHTDGLTLPARLARGRAVLDRGIDQEQLVTADIEMLYAIYDHFGEWLATQPRLLVKGNPEGKPTSVKHRVGDVTVQVDFDGTCYVDGKAFLLKLVVMKDIADTGDRFALDDIANLGVLAYNSRYADKVTGICYLCLRRKAPVVPRVVKDGTRFYKDDDIDTTRDRFMAAIEQHGFNPADYTETLERLRSRGRPFFGLYTYTRTAFQLDSSIARIQFATGDWYLNGQPSMEARTTSYYLCRDCPVRTQCLQYENGMTPTAPPKFDEVDWDKIAAMSFGGV